MKSSPRQGPSVRTAFLGRIAYEEAWALQRNAQRALMDGGSDEVIFLCEHPPTITIGKSAKPGHVLVDDGTLSARGLKRFTVERGGDVTYHGPGQIVAYPIVNLALRKRDVDWYMRLLEQAIIDTLHRFEIDGHRIKGKTGVWVSSTVFDASPRKIASLGVRISRWCTMHGVALNVGSKLGELSLRDGFACINPCGLGDVVITSIAEERGEDYDIDAVAQELAGRLSQSLTVPLQPLTESSTSPDGALSNS